MEKTKVKILVIDDDPDFIEAIRLILNTANYDVVEASNPQEGKVRVLDEKPDLILMDIMMDSLFDGFSLCNEIKTGKEFKAVKDTPIIHVSAVKELTGSRFQFKGDDQGMRGPDDYLDKPVKAEDLIARIQKHLKA